MIFARVIDYETTGTPEDENPEVIEMGSYDVDIATRRVDTGTAWQSLCRPRGEIPAVAKAVHHITEEDVASAPDARELWDRLLSITGETVPAYLVAHNAKFEQHFTPDAGTPWICTYRVARIVWPDAPGHSNQALRYWLDLDCDPRLSHPPHRALPDAYVTAHLFCRVLEHKTPDEMVVISRYPALLRRITFGKKAKGQTYEEAPLDYLRWIRDESDLNEDTKFSARYWLQKRTK
jgi:exodeoxyribonuclease X